MTSKGSLPFSVFPQKHENFVELEFIRHQFRDTTQNNFNDHLLYSFLAGKVAHGAGEPTSDIDCIVVLRDSSYNDSTICKRIKAFTNDYLKIHAFLGLSPDYKFPGDVISETQKEEAIAGRGFCLEGKFQCTPIITDEDWDKENIDYRVWLTELAFNNNMFITGDRRQFELDSVRAVDTVTKLLLSLHANKETSSIKLAEEIMDGGKSFLGFSRNYGTFVNYLEAKIQNSLSRLLNEGLVMRPRADGPYLPNKNLLMAWRQQLIRRAKKPVSYLISWTSLRKYVRIMHKEVKI